MYIHKGNLSIMGAATDRATYKDKRTDVQNSYKFTMGLFAKLNVRMSLCRADHPEHSEIWQSTNLATL
jgi:hypothetical protein